MTPPADPARYKNHRFPGEIISHGVWLYYRFPYGQIIHAASQC
jgi:transposase-like protein